MRYFAIQLLQVGDRLGHEIRIVPLPLATYCHIMTGCYQLEKKLIYYSLSPFIKLNRMIVIEALI